MTDSRFFEKAGPFSLAQLAEIAGAELSEGSDPDLVIEEVAPLDRAGPATISFLDNTRYLPEFTQSQAAACLVQPRYAERAPDTMALLLTDKPYSGYAQIAWAFYPKKQPSGGVHPTAVIDPSANIGADCVIGPYAVIGPRVEIGARCQVAAHVVIDAGVVIGDDTEIGPGASLSHCLIGRGCQLHAGVRIGNRGFGFAMETGGFLDVPQLGRVIVEDNVEIGANSTLDRGAGPDTVIGAGSKIDNLVQIGHNVKMGQNCVLVAQSGVAGSTQMGDQVILAAQSGLAGHLTLGRGAQVAAKSGVMRDIPEGQKVGGTPAMPIREFFRLVSFWQRQIKTQGKDDG